MPIIKKDMSQAERLLRAKLMLHGVPVKSLAKTWGIQPESAFLRLGRPEKLTLRALMQLGQACKMDTKEMADMVISVMEELGYEQDSD